MFFCESKCKKIYKSFCTDIFVFYIRSVASIYNENLCFFVFVIIIIIILKIITLFFFVALLQTFIVLTHHYHHHHNNKAFVSIQKAKKNLDLLIKNKTKKNSVFFKKKSIAWLIERFILLLFIECIVFSHFILANWDHQMQTKKNTNLLLVKIIMFFLFFFLLKCFNKKLCRPCLKKLFLFYCSKNNSSFHVFFCWFCSNLNLIDDWLIYIHIRILLIWKFLIDLEN